MTFRTSILAASAVLLAATGASATVQTITRSGHIVAGVPLNPIFNPDGLTTLSDLAVGDAIHFSATYDDADLQTPGTIMTAFGEQVSSPDLHIVQLGNFNPVNSASLTVGSHSLSLSDQICFQDAVCTANHGLEFPQGPTLMFYGSAFLGMDSCLIEGGGGPGTGIAFCQLTLDQIAGIVPGLLTDIFGYSRSDLYLIQTPDFADVVFIGQFDGAGIAAIPEPASWAMMIAGFGMAGGALRRRRTVAA
jgi:hypothetical protein